MAMKKVIVFGAAGRTGLMVVKNALAAGYKVTAFIVEHSYKIAHPNLTVIQGDALNAQSVHKAMMGHDIVISTVGTREIEGDAVNLMSEAMKCFIAAMEDLGIKRVLAVGGLGVLQLNETMQIIEKPDYPAMYKNVGEGHNKVYKVLKPTNLDWTFVCCPDIIDGEKTGKYTTKKDYPAEGLYQIFTGDLADFLVNEMIENKYLGTRVGICNTALS